MVMTFRPSETALKVAQAMVVLSGKPGWKDQLPARTGELSEKLILASRTFGYNPTTLRMVKQPWSVRLHDLSESLIPGIFEGLGRRKIFMNEQVLAAIEAGATQVLVVGAGLDTLALRLAAAHPGVQFFEVDHPATSTAKARGVAQIGKPDNLMLVAGDLSSNRLSSLMDRNPQWRSSARCVVVAEGLLYYLSNEDVLALFRETAACTSQGSRVAFSHLHGLKRHGIINGMLGMIGEPWLSASGSNALPSYIGPGWNIIKAQDIESNRDLEGFAVAERAERNRPNPTGFQG